MHSRSQARPTDDSKGRHSLPVPQPTVRLSEGARVTESVCNSSLHPGTITTNSQPVVPMVRELLFVLTVKEQEWEANVKGVAENEFTSQRSGGGDRARREKETVVHTGGLLHDLLITKDRHAALLLIADGSALEEVKLHYTDGGHLIKSLQGKRVFDKDFPELLSSYTYHENGDRDQKGRTRDGAFRVSSRSGKIKAACAALPVGNESWTTQNSGTRHKALVGVVEYFSKLLKPCLHEYAVTRAWSPYDPTSGIGRYESVGVRLEDRIEGSVAVDKDRGAGGRLCAVKRVPFLVHSSTGETTRLTDPERAGIDLGARRYLTLFVDCRHVAKWYDCCWDNIGVQDKLSKEVIDLMGQMLSLTPADRLSAAQLKRHPWFTAATPDSDSKLQALMQADAEALQGSLPPPGSTPTAAIETFGLDAKEALTAAQVTSTFGIAPNFPPQTPV
uniref:Uncharacterized protein n=1 Tax=Chromera velia CCMP2878 TaxID=1169474 RepID=A0A0G4H5K3_9ALVE|eukprot:Cvel_24716.t1-p1 / transcript=Cvel_24716.t1 / gene=Cvel_24716 / organism=Chromera_velia_CCMP2878 / gene_product=hypothetical protein / transcript_product=hypothetical protein / location=Cvel_scaffold2712:6697-10792(-) / protein_length=445 / sequence_SO=supercontig / SO=protein_coding / is_pseudo=false